MKTSKPFFLSYILSEFSIPSHVFHLRRHMHPFKVLKSRTFLTNSEDRFSICPHAAALRGVAS